MTYNSPRLTVEKDLIEAYEIIISLIQATTQKHLSTNELNTAYEEYLDFSAHD